MSLNIDYLMQLNNMILLIMYKNRKSIIMENITHSWLHKLQFVTPRAITALKKYERDMLRFRNRKQIKDYDPDATAFVWKYRIKDVVYDVTDLNHISFILVGIDNQTQTATFPDFFGDSPNEVTDLYRFLHEQDRFILGLIVADLAGREAKKEKGLKRGHQGGSISQIRKREK